MNKFQKVLIIFISLVVFLFLGAWQFIQTELFSSWVSKKTHEALLNNFGVNAEFKSIDIQMFPPATILKDVRIEKKNGQIDLGVALSVEELGVYFSLFNLFSSQISIENVVASNGVIIVKGNFFDDKAKNSKINFKNIEGFKIDEFFKETLSAVKNIPIALYGIGLKEIELHINKDHVWVNNVFVGFDRDYIEMDLSFENINSNMLPIPIDSLSFKGTLFKDNIDIEKFTLMSLLTYCQFKGKIIQSGRLEIVGDISYRGDGKELLKYIEQYDKNINSIDALWEINAKINGEINNPEANVKVSAFDFRSEYALLDSLDVHVTLHDNVIILDDLYIRKDNGSAKLTAPAKIFDLKNKTVLENKFYVRAEELYTNDFLYYLRDVIAPLKGNVTGNVEIVFDENVSFNLLEGSTLSDFHLNFNSDDMDILVNPKISINRASFSIHPDLTLGLNVDLFFAESGVVASGEIKQDYINITASSDNFDFEKFGPIAKFPLKGNGNLKFVVDGPMSDVRFYFDTELNKMSLLDLELGTVKGKLRLDLKDLNLYANEIDGVMGTSIYEVDGIIRFEEDMNYHFDVKFPYATYKDALEIFDYYLPQKYVPRGLAFSYSGEYFIKGNLHNAMPEITGAVYGKNLTWFNETAEKLDFKFELKNEIINVDDIYLRKRSGEFFGKLLYDTKKSYLDYNAKLENLRLNDIALYRLFNFGYDGRLSGSFKGDGKIDSLITRSRLKITNGNIFNQAMEDSNIAVYSDGMDAYVNGAFIGNIFTLDSYLNLNMMKQDKKSYINAAVSSTDVKVLTGIISEHNSVDQSIKGRINANLESTFTFKDWRDVNVLFELNEFAFRRENVKLRMTPIKRNIIIKNGDIAHWDILLKGSDGNVFSTGDGKLYDDFKIDMGFKIDSSISEVIFPTIQKSSGLLSSRWMILSEDKKISSHLELNGDDIYLKVASFPDAFEKVNMNMTAINNQFFIQKFEGKFGQGNVDLTGDVVFKLPRPSLNLNVGINQSRIPFFKKSSAVISGDIKAYGDKIPYVLQGDISLIYSELLDDFSDYNFGGEERADNKFVPKAINVQHIDFFNYDVAVNTLGPVILRNQMTDIKFDGNLAIGGSYQVPEIKGGMSIIPNTSMFMFKGHEFIITEGSVAINNDLINSSPNISLSAKTEIQGYKVKVDVSGKVDKFDVKLSSEPVLSQQDILSLLTLGVTSDVAKNLDDNDRESITSLGLGSLIIDQFKLNKGLNSPFGMKLSVLPAFGESNESMLHGRSSGNATSTKVKSATKIKLQTKIKDDFDLSFSSTMGGSMNQKQEMNLNYTVGKNTSLQFIYEKEESENEADESTNSIGVDFTFRKTFK